MLAPESPIGAKKIAISKLYNSKFAQHDHAISDHLRPASNCNNSMDTLDWSDHFSDVTNYHDD